MENYENKQIIFTDPRFIPTNELINELFSRFDHAIFAGTQERYEYRNKYLRNAKGERMACIGLSRLVEDYVLKCLEIESKAIGKSKEDL